MSQQTTTIQYNRAKNWQIMLFPLGTGVNNMFMVLMMFVSYVAVGGYGILTATAGMIATGTRMFDAVTDPIVALLTDRLNGKFGKVRIIMALGYTIMAISVFGIFFWGIGNGVVVYTLLYMLYILGYTFYGVGRSMGEAIITNDPSQRPKVSRYSMFYTTILTTLSTGVYLTMMLVPKHGGLTIPAFQEMCTTVVIVGAVLMLVSLLAISSKDKPESFVGMAGQKVGLKDCWKLIKANRALQMYIVAAASDKLALQTASNTAVTTMLFGIIIGNYTFNGQLSIYSMCVTLVMIFFSTRMAAKIGSKKALVRWTWGSIILSAVYCLFMVLVEPTSISVAIVPTALFIVVHLAKAAAVSATSACTGAMLPDVADYELSRSGNYMPGTVAATYSFVDKMISSFATTIAGFCIAAIGYVSTQPQIGDPSSPAIFWMTMFLALGMPVIGWLCTLVAMKWYPLDKEKMQEVQLQNQEIRNKAKAEAEATVATGAPAAEA